MLVTSAYAIPVYVLFVHGIEGMLFNQCTGASNDYSQSAKDADPYFKSHFHKRTRSPKASNRFIEFVE